MPGQNARRHTVPLPGESSFSRATIFLTGFESVRDIPAVSNATDRAQLVTDLTNATPAQAPSSTKPLYVYRHDARGLHRLEYTIDGSVWLPFSGVMSFANKAAADAFGTASGAYLTVGDRCRVGAIEYIWVGAGWAQATPQTSRTTSPTQSGITGPTVIDTISVTVALPSAWDLRVSAQLYTYSTVVDDVVNIGLRDGATSVAEWTRPANSARAATGCSQNFEVVLPSVSAGSHTYTLVIVRAAGTGSVTVQPGATTPNFLTIEPVL